ncbi:hypothetical protein HanRHA438_Chr17g0809371 [Helianthus annuus]|nr:hypothetical protein HanRHA438_Chr17g0809371 [Helianthus annuus]
MSRLASEISTDTTFFKRIPSLWSATSAPPMPEKSDSMFIPFGNISFRTER